VLACDLRFASRQNTLLGHWEVGVGGVPGGGPIARLSGWSVAAAHSKSSSWPMTSTDRARSNTDLSIE